VEYKGFMKDYRVKITIRNERLLSAIEEKGFVSVNQFCIAYNLPYQQITEVINGKQKPIDKSNNIIKVVENLLEILQLSVDEAFTKRQLQGFHKSGYELKVKEKDLLTLVNPAQNQERKLIEEDVKKNLMEAINIRLNQREKEMIKLRYGFDGGKEHTYGEIGLIFGVTVERARQIIKRAERRLKHPSVAHKVINSGLVDIFPVNLDKRQIQMANSFLEQKKDENINVEQMKRRLDWG